MTKKLSISMFATLALLTACGKPPTPTTTSPNSAPRIISTVPAATLNLHLIGATDHLVGICKYDLPHLPPSKQNLPIVGDYETINYELLLTLKPSAMIIQFAANRIPPRLREIADKHHIELINLRFDNTQDLWTSVRTLGRITNMPDAAEKQITLAQADLKAIADQYKAKLRPKVAYLVSPKLMLVSGGNNFTDEMITAAGGENLGTKIGDGFVETNRETLVKLAPEVLLIGAMDEPGTQNNDPRLEAWKNLPVPAARDSRVYLVTDANSLMASVNIGKNVRALAELIHRNSPRGP